MKVRRAAVALVALVVLEGCTTFNYLTQAASGQLELMEGARRIDDVVHDESTPHRTAALLREVSSIKKFGERHGLKPTGNYTEYVALDRPVVVWVVSACESLRFTSKTWAFPIVGSVPYLGWFHEDAAHDFARGLRSEGWDVDVRGSQAYSTLGWFHDPVLSTMLGGGDAAAGELADTVLHESLHATLYIRGQTYLDESVASFVGHRLAVEYVGERFGHASKETAAYVTAEDDGDRRTLAMHEAYQRLDAIYASARPVAEKTVEKQRVLTALRAELRAVRPVNNATLMQFKAYHSGHAELSALLAACGGSYPRFIASLRTLRPESFATPDEEDIGKIITPLAQAGCPG